MSYLSVWFAIANQVNNVHHPPTLLVQKGGVVGCPFTIGLIWPFIHPYNFQKLNGILVVISSLIDIENMAITPAKMTKNTNNSKSEKEASASVSGET